MATIIGDVNESGDAEISVEAYDTGLILLAIKAGETTLPIELSNASALALARRITDTAEGN